MKTNAAFIRLRHLVLSQYNKSHVLAVAQQACKNEGNFEALMQCFLSEEKELSKRAAWSLGWAVRQNPHMIIPHLAALVAILQKPGVHPATIRNAVRILEEIEIPEPFHGQVLNACFTFIEKPATPIAVKAFSLTILHRLSAIYPEIKNELQLIIQENWDHETPAFKSRGRKILASITTTK